MNSALLPVSVLTAGGSSAAAGGGGLFMMIIYMVIIFGAMYFFAIRPQKKEQKRLQTMISQMEVGDTVVTTSGFYGIVIAVDEEDCIVEFGNNKNCRIPMRKPRLPRLKRHPTPLRHLLSRRRPRKVLLRKKLLSRDREPLQERQRKP